MSNTRRWSLIGPAAILVIWFLGAYLPWMSSNWVFLNVLVAAGKPQLFTLPLAYPAVGMDGHTISSLLGLMVCASVLCAVLAHIHAIGSAEAATPDPGSAPRSPAMSAALPGGQS
ncbi:hypothetical protein [Mycobacteroides abscessus]|uniref:hypothetical protein n=1 Tax=Mycobacteroides abscessus TaxID=36809 RepID=UPI000C258F77|nr:hypothetical protein [Mycobacteroides abscessus]